MTKGNGVRATTPGLPSVDTGGVDPTVGKGNPDISTPDCVGGIVSMPITPGPLNPETADMGRYMPWDDGAGSVSMRDESGVNGGPMVAAPDSTYGEPDRSGSRSMQDMTGPKNTEPGHMTPSTGSRWSDNTGGNNLASHSGSDGRQYWD